MASQRNGSAPLERNQPVRVLVVDDEPVVLEATSRMLTDAGYAVSTAPSARAALQLLEVGLPTVHVVLTDVVMPETDGRTLGRLIGERYPALPVLYMSAYPENDVLHRGAPSPGLPFLAKPFSPESLTAAIQSLVDKAVSH